MRVAEQYVEELGLLAKENVTTIVPITVDMTRLISFKTGRDAQTLRGRYAI